MRKETLKNLIAYLLVIVMTVCMAACSVAEPAETTAATEAPAAAAPTEPVETKAAFVPERYEPTLPPEPTVPETEPTEPATEPVEEDEDDYYYEDDSSSGSDYTPAPEVPAEPTPTEAPAPVETTPPETEAPVTVSYDYNAAANYGNSYAASTYGWVVDSGAEGYYPASSVSIEYATDNGGQSYINWRMTSVVDSTYTNLGCESGYRVWCDCWESDGWIYFVVYYG